MMQDAEHLIHQEFAFVLGIEEDQIGNFITERINLKLRRLVK